MTSLYEWLIQSGHELPKDKVCDCDPRVKDIYCTCGYQIVNRQNTLWLEALKQIPMPTVNKELRDAMTFQEYVEIGEQALKQIEAPSLDKWKKLVELTPRGSEFENDPENIFKYLKERMDKLHSTLKENVLLKSQIEAPGEVSTCCQYSVKVEGKTTKYYVCKKCGKPCDTKEAPNLVELDEEKVYKFLKSIKGCNIAHLDTDWCELVNLRELSKAICAHSTQVLKVKEGD